MFIYDWRRFMIKLEVTLTKCILGNVFFSLVDQGMKFFEKCQWLCILVGLPCFWIAVGNRQITVNCRQQNGSKTAMKRQWKCNNYIHILYQYGNYTKYDFKMHFGDHILHNLLLLKSKNYTKLYKYFASSEFSPFSAKIRQFEVLPSANGNPSYCRIVVLPSATSSIWRSNFV